MLSNRELGYWLTGPVRAGIPRAMSTETPLLLALDFTGTLVFALNGALTAVRAERLDIFGVITLGMFTGLGGGTIRDVLLDALPPATFLDWRYLALAAGGGLIAFILQSPAGTVDDGDYGARRGRAERVRGAPRR